MLDRSQYNNNMSLYRLFHAFNKNENTTVQFSVKKAIYFVHIWFTCHAAKAIYAHLKVQLSFVSKLFKRTFFGMRF